MTFVVAHTNVPGNILESDWRQEESNGVIYDVATGTMVPYHNIDDLYAVSVSLSKKPPIFHWDHKSATDYYRGVSRVMTDSPFILHSHYDNPVDHLTSNYNYYSSKYISKLHTPFSASPVNGGLVENAWDQAVNQALLSIQGQNTDWGSSLGEMRASVEGLARDAKRGVAFIRHMRKGQWVKAANALGITPSRIKADRGKSLADHWLNYSYGWRPLAHTMYTTQQTFAEIAHRTSKLLEGNGSASVSGEVEFDYGELHEKGSWAASVHCTLKATLDNPILRALNQLGLTNPASIAWELVPFSFCVDWFLPIGNTLQAMTSGQGLSWHGGQITKRVRESVHISHMTGKITDWVDCVDGGNYSERTETFQRVALTGFPYARFYANLHPLGWAPYRDKETHEERKSDFNYSRALNALALVRQLHSN